MPPSLNILNQATDFPAEDGLGHFEHGRGCLREERWGEAVHAFEHAVRLEPAQIAWLYYLASAYGMNRQFNESVKTWEHYLSHVTDHADGYAKFGIILAKMHRFDESIVQFEHAIKLDPENAFHHYFLGLSLNELERYEDALQAFSDCVALKPEFADALYWQGLMFGMLDATAAACESLARCVEINPDHLDAQYNLCIAYAMLGKTGEAKLQCEIVKQLDKTLGEELYQKVFVTQENPDNRSGGS
jgi:tetratricopeptide (TPR) repeat protein